MKQYLNLLREIRDHGSRKSDRTGTGTLSVFGHQLRCDLGAGFPLLTLGVLTGMVWISAATPSIWSGSDHEIWSVIAWGIYAGLVAARFLGKRAGRPAALSALGGFAFLLFAVVGVELLA